MIIIQLMEETFTFLYTKILLRFAKLVINGAKLLYVLIYELN